MSTPGEPLELDEPSVEGVLPPDADGKVNLLPVSMLDKPLIVTVPPWANLPEPALKQRLRLLLDNVVVYSEDLEEWPPRGQPAIPTSYLTEGVHVLIYEVYIYLNHTTTPSDPFTLTIDRTPPGIDDFDDVLTFPLDLVNREVTEAWLNAHGDRLTAILSNYAGGEVSDEIVWHWDINGIETPVDRHRIDALNPVRTVVFSGDMIRQRDDGTAQAFFYAFDRAGNRSGPSDRVSLTVMVKPVPRNLPPPVVEEATGTGARQHLLASRGYRGVTVSLPSSAEIKDGDSITLFWGGEDQAAYHELPLTLEGGIWQTRVPAAGVLLAIDSSLEIAYQVTDRDGGFHDSDGALTLTIEADFELDTLNCPDLAGSQSLSLAALLNGHATVILPTWGSYMATGQTLRLQVDGVDPSGAGLTEPAETGRQLQDEELKKDVTLYIPTGVLQKFKMDTQVRFEAFVSFDGSNDWQSAMAFNRLALTLKP